jgi:hypothetical protein
MSIDDLVYLLSLFGGPIGKFGAQAVLQTNWE